MNAPFNAADRRHVRERAKAAKIDTTLDREVVVAIMQHANGRRWMFNKVTLCHIFATTHTSNALQSAFLEGERNIGLMFLADIMAHCPEQYVQMMRESNERERAAESRRRDPTEPESTGEDPDGGVEGPDPAA